MPQNITPITDRQCRANDPLAYFQQAIGDLHGKDEAYIEGFKFACAILGRMLVALDQDRPSMTTVASLVSVQH